MVHFVWLVDPTVLKDVLKYVLTMLGVQFVMIVGIMTLLKWSVINLDILHTVRDLQI